MSWIKKKQKVIDTERLLSELKRTVERKRKEIQEVSLKSEEHINETSLKIDQMRYKMLQSYEAIEQLIKNNDGLRGHLKKAVLNDEDFEDVKVTKLRIGERLLLIGSITAAQLNQALDYQSRYGGRIGDVLIELGYVTNRQINDIVDKSFRRLLLGEQLVQSGELDRTQLQTALDYQKDKGGDIGEILLSMNLITSDQLYRALATQKKVGRLVTYDKANILRDKMPEELARKFHAVIIRRLSDECVMAVESLLNAQDIETLSAKLNTQVRQVLASPWEMELLWDDVYSQELLHESVNKLREEQPENSASKTFTFSQLTSLVILGIVIGASLIWNWYFTLIAINIIIQIVYFAVSVVKFMVIMYGSKDSAQLRFTKEEIAQIDERDLPMYSILVPMYKESNVIPELVKNLGKLDYPKNKLDIRLLIEQDDEEAKIVIQSLKLPYYFQTLVVPDGQPRTKPKACNYGLIRARGDYVVIYDAEDRPEPDQLKKVYLAFKNSPENTVCVQAKLNYFNSDQNLLTRFFTQEYSNWFELLLPGIMQMNIPIPLGGTSNHFKTKILKELGAWDPYNVTEDADLGIRLYKQRYATRVVDSRTLEEANSRYGNWIRQRSRWIKGYMQTWLVHMRHPLKLHRELGFKGFWGAQFMLLSSPLPPILNPIFWSLLILWYLTYAHWIHDFFPGIIYYLAAVQLILGNFLFIYTNMAGTHWVVHELYKKKERWLSFGLIKYALLTPVYWLIMSIASWKALWQLIRKPFYWEKTVHGFNSEENINQ